MSFLRNISRAGQRLLGKHRLDDPHSNSSRIRICRFEEMEPRQVFAADLHFGAVYFEDATGDDAQGDTIQITFVGGAPRTQLTRIVIDGDKDGKGLSGGDLFFDTKAGGLGAFGSSDLKVVSHEGFTVVNASVADGSSRLVIDVSGFDPGEKLVLAVDVDEAQFVDAATGEIDVNALVEGGEFQRSLLQGSFTAPHFFDITGSATFFDAYDKTFAKLQQQSGLPLNLPPDAYSTTGDFVDRTAGAATVLEQIPLPITIAGTVFEDVNLNNVQEAGDGGLGGVQLALQKFNGASYVATGTTVTTNAAGEYKFEGVLPGTYRIVEAQPNGFVSVGAKAGTIDGVVVGSVLTADIVTEIAVLGGNDSIRNDFAEARPVTLSGHVYHDRNNNGIREAGEEGIGGVPISVQPVSTVGVPAGPTVVKTLADGSWSAAGLNPGTYRVVEAAQPALYFDGLDAAGTAGGTAINPGDEIGGIFLASGAAGREYNFGELLPNRISGRVHLDLDGDCTFEPGEAPLAGVTIELRDSTGKTISTTLTGADGMYEFGGLGPGSYTVFEVQPTQYIDGGQRVGPAGGFVAGDDLISGIVLVSDNNAPENNFCERPLLHVAGNVYVDDDNDGVFDPQEKGIGGATLLLLDGAGNFTGRTTKTSADGSYWFGDLFPGTYGVAEQQPAGFLDGLDAAGTAGGVAQNPGDRITGAILTVDRNGENYNFGELRPSSLSGHVHADLDGDCVFDPEEKGIAGVVIELLDAGGKIVATTLTDAQGNYKFNNLGPGTYAVREIQPAGYYDSGDHPGSAGGVVLTNDVISQVKLGPGVDAVDYNFCELLPASLRGHVHADVDGDCIFDPEESGIAGVTVHLLDAAGNIVRTTQTDAEGNYQFDDLVPGTYGVREIQPAGYFDSGDHPGSAGGIVSANDQITQVVLGSGVNAVDYNFCENLPASLSGHVHADTDGDCVRDPGEVSIAGVVIHLLDAAGNSIRTTRTDANGNYRFENLAPGAYGVFEEQPAGYFDSGDHPGSAGGIVSANDTITQVVLGSGVNAVEYNFCEHPPASIRGFVLVDRNGNCEVDPGELLLAGVTIRLRDSAGNLVGTTTTDAAGSFAFEGLAPGTYALEEVQPAAYFDGDDAAGSAGGLVLDSDAIVDITLGPGVDAVHYRFCEVPGGAISGIVFQDGPPLFIAGDFDPEIYTIRNGVLSPGDPRLAGVVLELRDGVTGDAIFGDEALPGYYAPDEPIRVVTDTQGNYRFEGLDKGNYAVYEVQPNGYIDGIDTPGSKGGIAVNPTQLLNPDVLFQLAVNPNDDAILRIILFAGEESVDNNFSELQTEPFIPPIVPPPPVTVIPPPPLIGPPPIPRILPAPLQLLVSLLPFGGSSRVLNYTWHLSVIDAGQPRASDVEEAVVKLTSSTMDTLEWHAADLTDSEWTLVQRQEGEIIAPRRLRFGMEDSVPVTGDFNGDGVTDIGVFKDGEWFIDLNGNGIWDEGDLWAQLGNKGDRPVTGDWDGDGKTDIGVYGPAWPGDPRAVAAEPGIPDPDNKEKANKNQPPLPEHAAMGTRALKLTAQGKMRADLIDHVFHYGTPKDVPVIGDWNGDGTDTIAVFHQGKWFLDRDGDGKRSDSDEAMLFGQEGDLPVVGDFNGDGIDELGIFRDGVFYLDSNGNGQLDSEDQVLEVGGPGDLPVVGDWNGDGRDEPGVYRNRKAG